MQRFKPIRFKSYQGFRIRGTVDIMEGDNRKKYVNEKLHAGRAFMLTFLVESGGKFGSVMNYDGTVMTAGACQNILVYPKEIRKEDYQSKDDQGSLPKLIVEIEKNVTRLKPLQRLYEMFKEEGWYLSSDGKIRWREDSRVIVGHRQLIVQAGSIVHGETLRNQIIGEEGRIPRTKSKARKRCHEWIEIFHEIFSDPSTFQTQILFEISHNFGLRASRPFEGNISLEDYFYKKDFLSATIVRPIKDLAMCFWWCNYVNAPGKAMRVLRACRKVNERNFGRALIRGLGNTTFGRWDDDIPTGRYRRVRLAAMKLGYWPEEFFDDKGPMPLNLPG